MGKKTEQMRTTPLANSTEFCGDCPHDNLFVDISDDEALQEARYVCQNCKRNNTGIYKFDAIYTAYQAHMEAVKPNRGKKSTVAKRYGKAIQELHSAGKSQREIAATLKLSPTTVNKFLKNVTI